MEQASTPGKFFKYLSVFRFLASINSTWMWISANYGPQSNYKEWKGERRETKKPTWRKLKRNGFGCYSFWLGQFKLSNFLAQTTTYQVIFNTIRKKKINKIAKGWKKSKAHLLKIGGKCVWLCSFSSWPCSVAHLTYTSNLTVTTSLNK